jgi:hypothetical protein
MSKALLLFAVTTAGLAGCGESTTMVKTAVTQRRSTHTPTATGQPSAAEEAPSETHIGTVPKEIGLRLDAAVKDLNSKKIPYKVIGGASGVVKNDWMVCEMIPSPRTHLEFGTTIRLIVARSCGQAKRP